MLYYITKPDEGLYLSAVIRCPDGRDAVYWTVFRRDAKVYKRLESARQMAARVGGSVQDQEGNTHDD